MDGRKLKSNVLLAGRKLGQAVMEKRMDPGVSQDFREKILLAEIQEAAKKRLEEHRDKNGWDECSVDFLLERLRVNVYDLCVGVRFGNQADIKKACGDIVNFTAMIYERTCDEEILEQFAQTAAAILEVGFKEALSSMMWKTGKDGE